MNQIEADEIVLGQGVVIHPTASIRGLSGKARRVVIGDYSYIGNDVQIICDDFELGDYSKIHHHTNVHGYKPCKIGHNAWIGQYCILDSVGGLRIGNNCGIGAHSQLWSHIKYGDTLEGCRFLNEKPLEIGNDVWFVGHCIVSPITAADKSMALVGSVVTRDMEFNTIYAGSPARAISDKAGPQFAPVTLESKLEKLRQYLSDSGADDREIVLCADRSEWDGDSTRTWFFAADRTYTKRLHPEEVKFMKYLLPEKAKFVPLIAV